MNRQEGGAECGDTFDAARNGIADIVQFEIDENLLSGACELTGERQSAGISELITDLVETYAVAKPHDHRLRGSDTR